MCGRFVRGGDSRDYRDVLEVANIPPMSPSYNVAPTQAVLAAFLQDGERKAAAFRWGLLPVWPRPRSSTCGTTT